MLNDVILESVGMHVPEKVVTNEDLVKKYLPVDLITVERIEKSTGIAERRFVIEKDTLETMARHAVFEAVGQVKIETIDGFFYVGNTVPDKFEFESSQFKISDLSKVDLLDVIPEIITITNKLAADLTFVSSKKYGYIGGCAHFLTALGEAYNYIKKGTLESAIVVTATDISRHLDWNDRNTAILFGDGACATILRKGSSGPQIIDFYESEDSSLDGLLYYEKVSDKWVARMPSGEAVYKAVIEAIGKCIENVKTNGYSVEDIDHFILHQANKKVIRTAQAVYEIPDAKRHMTIEKYGNTSSASLGITWCDALEQGKIKEGDKIMVIGFGAGFRWNYVLIQY